MKKVGSWKQKYQRKPSLMWELTVEDMKTVWAPTVLELEEDESAVALTVANAFLEDAPSILRVQDILIPSVLGDQDRAQMCFLWLTKKVIPMWIPAWINRTDPYSATNMKCDVDELEEETALSNEQLGRALMSLRFLIPEADKVHRRSMHKAQQMGVRAAYRGALLHENEQVHMLALLAANLIVFAVPDQENYKESLLLVEATQSSALMMLDNLLLERTDA
jgi:hypothetical protein